MVNETQGPGEPEATAEQQRKRQEVNGQVGEESLWVRACRPREELCEGAATIHEYQSERVFLVTYYLT